MTASFHKDIHYSMLDDLQNLRKLASNLTEEFKLVSEDFLIGKSLYIFDSPIALRSLLL